MMNTEPILSDEQHEPLAIKMLRDFAAGRRQAALDGLESPELAALLVEVYARGVYDALITVAGRDSIRNFMLLADQLSVDIDPNHVANRRLRYERVAKLDLETPRAPR